MVSTMLEVILSQQYQVPIPQEIRDLLNLKAGQKFTILLQGDSITLVPKPSIQSLRGVLKGANISNVRDRSERV
ncbi:MAG: AbrB family transcriptional regulator [Pseudanabaena sp.]|nr:MAG: AbrB family transcriptional regulator [Pseudanabaena sp.]